ncbi:MAG: protein translocase subunit SecF [candidate division KSB1 bacterium]|nr:protein translocase subunit SecF [candidate division KSB1 bacterium]MDZ7274844.1 protein translocase subunit SecF [candidate division KSB1 bacterium]MDZ7288211.1 protein translocase subunit SecF [candidate division KSB1 bacterium]MDZ7300408.1 protein translocase subunit SecF [candidate division KSB1 bacterium]MDZ7308783.1 protein translocase subunit SecF [candidate division KSB1 bacterium]
MEFLRQTNIDFLGRLKFALAFSLTMIVAGIVSLLLKGGPLYGIDFLGGTEVNVKFQNPQQTAQVRQALSAQGITKAEIKQFGDRTDFLIRVQQQESGTQISEGILAALQKAFPHDPPALQSVDSVGPKIGQELRDAAIWAIIIALGLILIYISFRFEFVFAVGAVIALVHDVMITLGLFSLFNMEINLAIVAAFLTLVGYSLNDTIVVYDRIRENMVLLRREAMTIEKVVNLSINQTLSRTILTSGTTLIVVVILFLFGGEVIRGFSFCMLAGIIVGTYSSIFIAAPLVVEWYHRHQTAKIKMKPVGVR